jgi:KDO2-lipid IV(A) lauroyltransferase
MLAGSFAARFLPLGLAYLLARALGWCAYWFFRDVRNVARGNLCTILGPEATDEERERLVKSLFAHMALNAVDFLRFPHYRYPDRLVTLEGLGLLEDLYAKGKGIVFVSPHLGNWEVGGMLLVHHGFRTSVVTESIKPRKTRFKENRIADLYRRYREDVGMNAIPLEQSGVKGLRALKRGEILVLLADRDISGSGVEVPFFGKKSRVPKGPAVLALRTGAPIVLGTCVRRGDGGLKGVVQVVEKDSEDPIEVTKLIVQKMELLIRQYPDQWFVFQPPWR